MVPCTLGKCDSHGRASSPHTAHETYDDGRQIDTHGRTQGQKTHACWHRGPSAALSQSRNCVAHITHRSTVAPSMSFTRPLRVTRLRTTSTQPSCGAPFTRAPSFVIAVVVVVVIAAPCARKWFCGGTTISDAVWWQSKLALLAMVVAVRSRSRRRENVVVLIG